MSLTDPLVSVLLPVRNGGDFIAEALTSVLEQSLRDLEVVVVDDGSTDATVPRVHEFSLRDGRIRVVKGDGLGLVSALNAGLALCRGRFIARMDADDICRPRRILDQVVFFKAHPDVGVVGGQLRCFGPGASRQYRYPITHDDIQAASIFECPLAHPAVMFRRSLLAADAAAYDPSLGNGEDYGLWTRWLEAGVRFAALPSVVLDYRVHASQVSTSERADQVSTADRIRRHWLLRLGLKPSPREMELHGDAGRGRWGNGMHYLKELECWLLRLRGAGANASFLDSAAFDRALAQRWTSALWANRGIGGALRRMLGASPLGDLPHPQVWKPWAVWAGSFAAPPADHA